MTTPPNKTDAGNGSRLICRVIDAPSSPSPDPSRYALPRYHWNERFASSSLRQHPCTQMDFYCDQVLSGRIAIERIAETEQVLAFHHTQPYWPVHVVVIPKRHIASLAALEPGDLPAVQEMLVVATELCRRITNEHGGCRLSTNSGDYQSTKHLHFYIHHGPRIRDEHGAPITQQSTGST